MQKFKFNINGKGYEAIVEETERNTARVELNGKSYTVQIEKEEAVVSPKIAVVKPTSSSADFEAPQQVVTGNAGSIKSPLPGNVSKIKVQEGQAVKAGDVLMTLEAMKMENEIMAPAAGTVKKIYVAEGKAVQQGEALIDLA
ncbi:MAG: biotin/lipoyl-binding protein [Rikenellaceae bacterium]|nr:biotin/lipoyl-binding protein [Rikenellaceae bacterium]